MANADEDDDLIEQQNELSALSSIYDDEIFQPHQTPPLGGTLRVLVNLPPSFKMVIERSQDQSLSYDISYLPAICLDFTYPKNYPSLQAPDFTLSCCWLNRMQVCIDSIKCNVSYCTGMNQT